MCVDVCRRDWYDGTHTGAMVEKKDGVFPIQNPLDVGWMRTWWTLFLVAV